MKRLSFAVIFLILTAGLLACASNEPWSEDFHTEKSILRYTSAGGGGYWHEYNFDAISLSPGGSGATQINPNASSLGGYRLDAIGEYVYFTTHVEDNWDSVNPGIIEIWFEVNMDNTGGLVTDTVQFQLESWHKIQGEQTNTVYSLDSTTVVGQADQHDLFEVEIPIVNLRPQEIISYRLNLNTIMSQVDNVIVNYIEFKYPSYLPALER